MLRSIGVVLGGYAAMVIIVMLGTIAAVAMFLPGGASAMKNGLRSATATPAKYLTANLLVSLLGAIVAGCVTARIASAFPMRHVFALAAFVIVMSVVSARQTAGHSGGQPSWYPWVIAMIGVGGTVLGGVIGTR